MADHRPDTSEASDPSSSSPTLRTTGLVGRVTLRLARLLGLESESERRLREELASFRSRSNSHGTGDEPWTKKVAELVTATDAHLAHGRFEEGWATFLAANQEAVSGYDVQRLEAEAAVLRAEVAEKLPRWRGKAALALLTAPRWPSPEDIRQSGGEASSSALTRAQTNLRVAMRLRDEAFVNTYRRIAIAKWQLTALGAILLVILAAIYLSWAAFHPEIDSPLQASVSMVWLILWFGSLGGCISAMSSVAISVGQGRIPERRVAFLVTAVRPLVGAASALGVFAIVALGTPLAPQSNGAMLGLAFVSGFSERFLIGAVGGVTART